MCMYRVFYVNIRCLCVWKEDGRIILLLFVISERCINLGDLILTEKNSYCLSLLMACLRNIRTQTILYTNKYFKPTDDYAYDWRCFSSCIILYFYIRNQCNSCTIPANWLEIFSLKLTANNFCIEQVLGFRSRFKQKESIYSKGLFKMLVVFLSFAFGMAWIIYEHWSEY